MEDGAGLEEHRIPWKGRGKLRLAYSIPKTEQPDQSCIILAPASGGGMNIPLINSLHMELARNGFSTVKFNLPYTGGLWSLLRIPIPKEAALLGYRTIIRESIERFKPARLIIGGLSLGAYASSILAAQDPDLDIQGFLFLGYPLHSPGRPKKTRKSHLYNVTKPMLFISGEQDPFARPALLEELVSSLGPKAQLHLVEHANHVLNPQRGKEAYHRTLVEVADLVASWAKLLPLSSSVPGYLQRPMSVEKATT